MSTTERIVAWVLVALAVTVSILGYVLNWYEQFSWFDEIVHAFTIFAIALLLTVYLYGVALTGARTYPVLFVIAVVSLGLAVGSIWEVAEWIYDQLVRRNAILGKTDTIIDLVMDTLGGVVAGLVAMRMARE